MADINVWLALVWENHQHSKSVWTWYSGLDGDQVYFCRLTQIGLLRLLNTKAVMGTYCYTVKQAWTAYERCLEDPKIGFLREPIELDGLFRACFSAVSHQFAPKLMADGYLLALSQASDARLVTLDSGLASLARKTGHAALLLE